MKGVIDGIIRTEHISLNRSVGFGSYMFKLVLVGSRSNKHAGIKNNTHAHTHERKNARSNGELSTQKKRHAEFNQAHPYTRTHTHTQHAIISFTAVMKMKRHSPLPSPLLPLLS